MNISFMRSHNQVYRYTVADTQGQELREIFLHYESKIGSESYETAQTVGEMVFRRLSENLPLGTIKCQDKLGNRFEVEIISRKKWHRFARYLTRFFKFLNNDSKIEVRIKKVQPALKNRSEISPEVCLERPLLAQVDWRVNAFHDSYTEFAAEAFQKYEPEFVAHDDTRNLSNTDHCQYKIIHNEGKLQLVRRDSSLDDQGDAIQGYITFICKEYGIEKINYILHLYRIDLRGPLTPEIIYRINIGVGNLEKQDLTAFANKIDDLQGIDQLNEADLRAHFTTQELRGIGRSMGLHGELTSEILREWIASYQQKDLREKLKGAIEILSFTPTERSRQYTGREILYPIMSRYTIADNQYYKPWVDQQELLQIFPDLEDCYLADGQVNWDRYCELLTHVVSKKHLARRHPNEIYRVGALIPAPRDQEGHLRWYVVSSCVSNGKGMHSYTLEPLDSQDQEDSLPAIKLYRSTAASPYALDNYATVLNDINPINSPGYEGFQLSKKYEEGFFKKRTIPLWVGYHLQAAQVDDEAKKIEVLDQAIKAYSSESLRPYVMKPLGEVIRQRDSDILEIVQGLMQKSWLNLFKVFRLILILFKYKTDALLPSQKRDAEFLLTLIDPSDSRYEDLNKALRRSVGEPLLGDELREVNVRMAIIDELRKNLGEKKLDAVASQLDQLAERAEELPRFKMKQSMILTGHSLGGSCAAKAFVEYTAEEERVPLSMSLRTFDAPAINELDNMKYQDYGNHAALFQWLKARFSIVHRFEAGDFISQAGEVHLGASTEEERRKLEAWTHFEASVTESLERSRASAIRDTPVAHGTQFEKGQRHSSHLLFSYAEYKSYLSNRVNELRAGNDSISTVEGRPVEESWCIAQLEEQMRLVDRLAKERIGDYERTWIDPMILKKFDQGDKRNWSTIQTVFKVFGVRSDNANRFRLILGVVIRIFLSWLTINKPVEHHDAGHGVWWLQRDAKGVLAIKLR
ncbi:MAG: hypothetical protein ACHQUC_09125 [Chlamydiales bacterium]